uniref:Dirigent protein n=1 Tax=Tetradesmus obliquus TaxID=3088 RepID=A0A383VX15_TETOB|eukprot:jgi/Sobl393_1/13463/SZX70007.1
MAPRPTVLAVLVLIFSIVTICAAQADVQHGWGKPPTLGALSKLDTSSKTYAWVTRDKSYEYYRMKLSTFSISAKLFDIPTGVEVGVFASVCTFTAAPVTSPTIPAVCQATFEFGPDGNDSLAIVGSADVDILALTIKGLVWVDTDFAIVGGTGCFTGAFGRHASKGIDLFKYETVVTAYVPRVREF